MKPCRLDKIMHICQNNHDNKLPDDDECEHCWRRIKGNEYATLYRCIICGAEELD
jgi:hypothetical protein